MLFRAVISTFFLFSFLFQQEYLLGDQIEINDQGTTFEICYGDYPESHLALADFNGNLNGGNYGITILIKQTAY